MTARAVDIRRVIVHKLDPHDHAQTRLSDEPIGMPLTPNVERFLVDQIQDHIGHRRARRGVLTNKGCNPFLRVADELLAAACDMAALVRHSKEIAQQLFVAMQSHPKISAGDLALCLYGDLAHGPDPCLALLKLDRRTAFRGVARTVGTRTQVELEEVGEVHMGGELQKCAFLLPASRRSSAGYDLIVLDQQTSRFNATRQVASFFQTRFLQAEVGLNRVELTQAFMYGSIDWFASKPGRSGADRLRFQDRVYQVAAGEQIDIVAFADEALADVKEREEYIEYLQRLGVAELTFAPDPQARQRIAEFVTFIGDNDLRVRVRRDALGPGLTVDDSLPEEDGYTIVRIRTRLWRDPQAGPQ